MPDERPPSSLEEKRARLARALARRAAETVEAPLSFAQEPLWFADQLDPGSPLFNITLSVRVRGPLSEGFVRRAMVTAVARHEPLRTTFAARDGVPVQRIAPTATPELRFFSLADLAGEGLADQVERFVRAETRTRFDLSKGPLLRTAMVRLAPEDHLVAFTVHHIVADGWSVGVLLQELATAFARENGRPVAPPPPLTLQLRDFARRERERLQGDTLDDLLGFWRRQLAGAPFTLDLPTDKPARAHPTHGGDVHRFRLTGALSDALRSLVRGEQATPFMALFAGFAALLYRYSRQEDLLIGVPMSGRDLPEFQPPVGLFVNIVAVRARPRGDLTFRELLSQVRSSILASLAHQELPFRKVVEAVQPKHTVDRPPLVQVIHLHQAFPLPNPAEAPELTIEPWEVHSGFSRFELALRTEADGQGFACQLEYSTDLYRAETIADLAQHYQALLEAAAARPDLPLAELPLVSAAATGSILACGPSAQNRIVLAETIHEAFAAQAVRTPSAMAVTDAVSSIEYGDLDARAEALADELAAGGCAPGTPIGLAMAPTAATVVGLLGILKAGGACVPLDPDDPSARQLRLLAEAGARTLLADDGEVEEDLRKRLPADATVTLLTVPHAAATAATRTSLKPRRSGGAEDGRRVALILPADSTADGRPLAVELGHAQILARVATASCRSELRPGARHALVPPLTALAIVGGILEPLLTGGEVHLMSIEDATTPARCGRRLREGRFDVLHAAPSQAAGLLPTLEAPEARPRHCLLLDGEDVAPDVAARLRMLAPGLLTLCRRTPPETAGVGLEDGIPVADPAGAFAPEDSTPRSRPMPGSVVCVVDRSLRPVPRGVPGEICLGGDSVARGYVGRAAETSARFVTVRLPSGESCRFFRTGEIGRLRPEGTVQRLQGEVDVIWTRGYRGRAGEIEAALGAQPLVARCAVVPLDADGTVGAGWVACVEAARPGALSSDELRRLAQSLLPARLVPTAFMVLDRLPVGADGRIDRTALPRPGRVRSMLAPDHLHARTSTERTLVRIWEDLFGFEGIGIHDDFFELGGNSLMASLLVGAIRDRWPVEMPLHELFESPTIANVARRIDASTTEAADAEPSIPRTPPGVPQPLSSSQEVLWLIEQFDRRTAFNALFGARISGPLDRESLARALSEVLRRHSVLRYAIVVREGRPAQVACPPGALPLEYHDLGDLAPAEAEARAAALAEDMARVRIDTGAGCLIRFLLARTVDGQHSLFVTVHHMASDGWSVPVLWREVATLYEAFRVGRPSPLPDPPIQFADWACWQRRHAAAHATRQTAFWREKLRGPLPILDLPTDFPRPTSLHTERGVCPLDIPSSVARPLIEIGRRAQATPFMTLLAAYAALLSRFSQQEDLLVGTPVANRLRPETHGMIGFFAGLLPLRFDLAGDPSFEEMLARARQTCLEAFAVADPDWEPLQAAMPPHAPGRMPVFQAFFTLGEFPTEPIASGPLTWAPFEMSEIRFSGLDLVLALREREGGYSGALLYRRDLFAAETAARLRDGLVELIAGIVAHPASPISRLPLLPAAERHRIVEEWNATSAPFPEEACVHELVEDQARATPAAPALVHQGRTVSYAELDGMASALARRLRGLGVGPEKLVAVLVERGPEMVACLLAVWKAGGAYVPLDPSWPAERMAAVLRGAGAGIALSQRSWAARLAEVAGPDLRVLCIDGDDAAEVAAPEAGGQGAARPSNLAYVLYTSGSTGVPKGVMIEHRSVTNVVTSFCSTYCVGPDDRVLHQAPLAFDVSVNEIFPVLAAGGAVVIPRQDEIADFDRLAALVAEQGVTIMAAAPSALAELNRRAPQLASLRLVMSGGEALSRFDVDRLLQTAVVTNGYGPTEATICATYCDLRQLPPDSPAAVPIGRPLPNYRVYVLDRQMQLLPVGCPGELCIAGVGLARGYLGDTELTAARFVADPFEPGGRLYRTGDLARWRPDGQLEFLGRLDRQVKIRGCRVELGDVEAALREHPGVQDAAVTLLPDAGDGRLVAYVVPRPGGAGALLADVRSRAERVLPAHMRPAAWVLLPELPLTASGKVDVARLPAPQATRPETGVPYAEPQGATEAALAQAWANALGIDRVGRHDNFFDLGGHSLLAAQVIQKLQEALHVAVPYRFFLETPTLEPMALRIDRLKLLPEGAPEPAAAAVDPLVRFPSAREGLPVFLVHALGGGVNEYQHLAREIGAHWPVRGLQSRALADWTAEHASWEAMAEGAARTVRREQAEGPYRLVGFSSGGVLALAVARAIERDGCQVQLVCLLDSLWGCDEPVVARGSESALMHSLVGVVAGLTPQFDDALGDLMASSNPFDVDFVHAPDEERLRRMDAWLSELPVPTEVMVYLRNRLRLYVLHHRLLQGYSLPRVEAPLHAVWADVPLPGTALQPHHDWGTCGAAGATNDSVATSHWSMLVPPAVSEVAARIIERLRAAAGAERTRSIRKGT